MDEFSRIIRLAGLLTEGMEMTGEDMSAETPKPEGNSGEFMNEIRERMGQILAMNNVPHMEKNRKIVNLMMQAYHHGVLDGRKGC